MGCGPSYTRSSYDEAYKSKGYAKKTRDELFEKTGRQDTQTKSFNTSARVHNTDVRPEMLLSFAKMGSVYMKGVMDIASPTVGIVNIGAEEEKGNALVKETFPLLKAEKSINFIGSVEARDIASGVCDVIVCDAFVGNVVLKMYEGVAKAMLSAIKKGFKSSFKSKLGAALALPSLKKTLKNYDVTRYGGAPLLGINGLVVKTHGSAKAVEVRNTVLQCVTFRENDVKDSIAEILKEV